MSKLNFRICRRWLTASVLGLALSVPDAQAADSADLSYVETIHTLADRDNATALRQLREYKDKLGPDAAYAVRAEVLKTLISLLYDGGKTKEAEQVNAELLALARAHQDMDMIGFAQIGEAFKLQEQGKQAEAIVRLNEIKQSLQGSQNPLVLMRLNSAFGSMYHSVGNFEKALEHYLEALRLADQLPRRKAQAKLYRLEAVASLYISMHNAEKALATANEGLELAPAVHSPKTISSLSMVQGIALTELGRNAAALQSYQRVLQIAREAGMPGTEATALSNISDHYLHMHNFVEAERYARLSLAKYKEVGETFGAATAKANVGFALAGQGKLAQGIEFIDESKKYFKDINSKSDIEALLGEIASMYENAHMYKEALLNVREQQKLNDELFRSDRAKAVAALQEQFNAEQRQKQIELLARENQLKDADLENRRLQQIISMLAAVVTVMVGVFIFFLYRRVRKTNERLREVNLQLEFHAVRDPLTGLYNRRSFVDMMKNRIALVDGERRADSQENPDCLMLMDIDHFKHINDSYGHAVGDAVLMEVAHRLRKSVRDSDMVLRWGGEEFMIYSPRSNPAQLTHLVERVLRAIGGEAVEVGDAHVPVTLTAGFITLPFSGVPEAVCDWEKALQIADMALYLGKVNGRNRAYGVARLLTPYEDALPVLERDLSAAIKAGMVELSEVHGPARADLRPENGMPHK
ncbi:MAG: GGDEF domain-containing protein [Burkholderiales bacterium]|nr:GGDEF domain-containing protein [Burkholderiales bacterium]